MGKYALWDDESVLALAAEGVQRTGDTSVILGENIVAYRNGLLVRDGKDRSTPPLSTYLTAASFEFFGTNAWAARFPSACLGFATAALLLWWSSKYSLRTQIIFSLGLAGNVSFFLFCRQSRYYAATLFFSTAIAYLYSRWKGGIRSALCMGLLGFLLFAANYLSYAALAVCLIADFSISRRKHVTLSSRCLLALIGPQAIGIGMISMIWNPFRTGFGGYVAKNSLLDRIELFWWNLRDLNAAEMLVGPLMLVGFYIAIKKRNEHLMRMLLALFLYAGFISLVSPQTLFNTSVADIRYLVPLIPLGIAISTIAINKITKNYRLLWFAIALLAFQTNVMNGGLFLTSGARSTVTEFAREIILPLPEPYTLTANWIIKNVKQGESVAVFPDYMVYPLMFSAPHAVYAWQLKEANQSGFQNLSAIHYEGRVPPDYFIIFGPYVSDFVKSLDRLKKTGWHYKHCATINTFWKDLYRPELFWRTFHPILEFDPKMEAIQIFRRTTDS